MRSTYLQVELPNMSRAMTTCRGKPNKEEFDESNNSNANIGLKNPHLKRMEEDTLYHLAMGTRTHDFQEMFGDVKFVCMGGTSERMETFAHFVMKTIGYQLPIGTSLIDISKYRYSMYKIGPVLSISHGMGVPSIGILLHEVMKLLYHANVTDPIFFRIGTSGGIGYQGGTVVISDEAIDGMGNNYYEVPILGKLVRRPAIFNEKLIDELKECVDPEDSYKTVTGTTLCANDFYEGQARLDGAFCDYNEEDKMNYLRSLKAQGVANMEMEALPLAALTHHAGIKAADVCVTLLDRLQGDQVDIPKHVLEEWQLRPQKLVARYIKKVLQELK